MFLVLSTSKSTLQVALSWVCSAYELKLILLFNIAKCINYIPCIHINLLGLKCDTFIEVERVF